ncbi:MAG: sterol desaturase family protein [Bacteroidia bacterium]
MQLIINIAMVLIGFIGMEATAWFTHKYIMHGFMWSWHQSHHEPRTGKYEKNDRFGLVFALISAFLIVWGTISFPPTWSFYLGLGIMLYGLAYFLVHDVFVHQRLPWFKNTNSTYFKAMRFAHKIHHKTTQKEGAEAFGFLFVSKKYIDKYRNKNN